MASQRDVRRIALSLPGTREQEGRFAFSVENKGRQKGFAWVWLERVQPGQPRVPRADVLAVRVRDQAEKALLLGADPERFFTEPHYNGFPAVLVRLRRVTASQLEKLLVEAWRCQAPRQLTREASPPQPAAPLPAASARRGRGRPRPRSRGSRRAAASGTSRARRPPSRSGTRGSAPPRP